MARCSRCTYINLPEALFCAGCSEALSPAFKTPAPQYCPACGNYNPPQAKFCAACATRLPLRETLRPVARQHKLLYILLAVGIGLILLFVGVPFAISRLVVAPTAKTPTPPPQPQTIAPPMVYYQSNFSNPDNSWAVRAGPTAKYGPENGEYQARLTAGETLIAWNPQAGQFTDMILEIDGRIASGDDATAYGLVFRFKNENNFYRFNIFSNGYYVIAKKVNGQWTDLKPFSVNPFANKGNTTNHLMVICNGTRIMTATNGHYLTTIYDDSFTSGYVGMFVGTRGPDNHVIFDNIKVSKVPGAP